jgi:hypothetical protein
LEYPVWRKNASFAASLRLMRSLASRAASVDRVERCVVVAAVFGFVDTPFDAVEGVFFGAFEADDEVVVDDEEDFDRAVAADGRCQVAGVAFVNVARPAEWPPF